MKKVRLSDVCSIRYGKDHKKLDLGNIPVYGSGGIMRYANNFIYNKPSVLIPRIGTLDNLFFVDEPFWTVNTLFWTEIDESQVLPRYLFYVLKQKKLSSLNEGTAVPSLTTKTLNAINIDLPDIKWQQEVVKKIEPIEIKIKTNTRINNNLENQILSFYDHMFVKQKDPCWKKGTLSDIGTIVGGGTPSKSCTEYYAESGIAWITPKDLSINKSKYIYHGQIDISDLGLKKSSARLVPMGTVLFSSRAPIGYIAIAGHELTTNQGFKSVIPNQNIGTAFIYCFLKRNLCLIESMSSGSTFNEVSGSVMKEVPVTIPSQNDLIKFNQFTHALFEQQKILEKENCTLAAIRDNLLSKFF